MTHSSEHQKCQYTFPDKIFKGHDLLNNSRVFQFLKSNYLPAPVINFHSFSLIKKGVIVLFWVNQNGSKTIIDFKKPGEVLRPAIGICTKKTGEIKAKTLLDTEIISIDRDYLCACIFKEDKIYDFYHQLLSDDISSTYRQLKLLKEVDIEKRYEIFLEEYKDIYNEVSDRMIANFLGVHYVTLSRMKSRLLSRAKI